jgi:hypothetical protein
MFDSRLEVDTGSNRIAYPALMSDAVEPAGAFASACGPRMA